MSEKTEKPTQHTLKKAREKADVAKSTEFVFALLLMTFTLVMWMSASLLKQRFCEVFVSGFERLSQPKFEGAFLSVFSPIVFFWGALLLGLLFLSIVLHLMQSGWVWKFKRSSKKAHPRFFYPILKFGVIGAILFIFLWVQKFSFEQTHLFDRLFLLLFLLSGALLVLGIGDFFYQKWKFYQQMHMTQKERQDEQRELEGDAQTKTKMKQR